MDIFECMSKDGCDFYFDIDNDGLDDDDDDNGEDNEQE